MPPDHPLCSLRAPDRRKCVQKHAERRWILLVQHRHERRLELGLDGRLEGRGLRGVHVSIHLVHAQHVQKPPQLATDAVQILAQLFHRLLLLPRALPVGLQGPHEPLHVRQRLRGALAQLERVTKLRNVLSAPHCLLEGRRMTQQLDAHLLDVGLGRPERRLELLDGLIDRHQPSREVCKLVIVLVHELHELAPHFLRVLQQPRAQRVERDVAEQVVRVRVDREVGVARIELILIEPHGRCRVPVDLFRALLFRVRHLSTRFVDPDPGPDDGARYPACYLRTPSLARSHSRVIDDACLCVLHPTHCDFSFSNFLSSDGRLESRLDEPLPLPLMIIHKADQHNSRPTPSPG